MLPRKVTWLSGASLLLLFAGILRVLVQNAWLGDDAYISFRVVDHLVAGYGLRYNVAERVQAFTNPLWVLLLSPFYLVWRDIYVVSFAVSIVLSMATLYLLLRLARERIVVGMLGVAVLISSRSFVDYTTSGLENPLSNLLITLFAWALLAEGRDGRRTFLLFLLGSLLATNRIDLSLIVTPALALELWRGRRRSTLVAAALGLLPIVVWELFSIVYYGFPFPNTAYAKLATGLPRGELLLWGLRYVRLSLTLDPLPLVPVVAAAIATALRRRAEEVALVAGAFLYLAYVVHVGGDFMIGRFLVAPTVACTAVLVRVLPELRPRTVLAVAAALVAVILLDAEHPIRTGPGHFDASGRAKRRLGPGREFSDERSFYHPWTNPLRINWAKPRPDHALANRGRAFRDSGKREVKQLPLLGFRPFYSGPGLHVVDTFALADPLRARLPIPAGDNWRPGHYRRHFPPGYLDTLITGEDRFTDRDLAEYHRKLSWITRGPLFSADRWRAIVEMNTGRLDHLIDESLYRTPTRDEFYRRSGSGDSNRISRIGNEE